MAAIDKRTKILIVDDEYISRRVVEKYIRDTWQCQVQQAEDGSNALRTMLKEPPNLVILDMLMPFMNGLEVLRTMKQNAQLADIPVIACTSVDDKKVVQQVFSYGLKYYVVKPVNKETLIDKISTILDAEPVSS